MSSPIDITKDPYNADKTGLEDASEKLMQAIKSFHPTRRGKIFIPSGTYKFEKTVDVTSPVVIEGEGGHHQELGSTTIVPDLGVTAFRIWAGDTFHPDSPKGPEEKSQINAQRSVIRDLVISRKYLDIESDTDKDYYNQFATGDLKNGPEGVGRKEKKGERELSSRRISNYQPPSPEFIKRWQLISISGAGPDVQLTTRVSVVKVNTVNKTVNFQVIGRPPDSFFDRPPGIYEGAYVKIPKAGISRPSEITSVGTFIETSDTDPTGPFLFYLGFTIKYENDVGSGSSVPITDAKDCVVFLVCDLLARATDIDETKKSLTIDTHEDFQGISLFNLKIRHADAGIDMMQRARCDNILVYGIRGPAFAVIADNESIPTSNANNFQIENCLIHDCEYGLYILGRDTNDGTTINFANLPIVNAPQLIEKGINNFIMKWGIADLSFLGNAHIAPHFSGGYGAITRGGGHNRSVFIRTYHEDGTVSFFGENTIGVGGELRYDQGGYSWTDGIFNRFSVGETNGAPAFSLYRRLFYPNEFLEKYKSKNSTHDYTFRKTHVGDGAVGWYGHVYEGQGNWGVGEIPFCWSDKEADGGPAQFWAPGGIQVGGRQSNGKLNVADKRTLTFGSAAPERGAWKQGDILFNIEATSGGISFWQCTSSGSPGIWVAHTL